MASRVTQVTVEFIRGRYTDVSSAQTYVSQLTLEMLVPYVDLSTYYQKSASNAVTFATSNSKTDKFAESGTDAAHFAVTASASFVPGITHYAKSASNHVTFAPTASSTFIPASKHASNHVTFAQAASKNTKFAESASNSFTFSLVAPAAGQFPRSASNSATFDTANYLHLPEVVFDGRYRGRYQAGREVNLLVQARTADGVPAVPDSEPNARIYGPNGYIATVPLVAVKNSATTGLFGRAYKLGTDYVVGRYDVLYSWLTQANYYNEPDIFEVDDGGDPTGVVISSTVCYRPDDMYVLAQVDTGRIMAGRRPQLATVRDSVSVDSPPPTSPAVVADASYLGRIQVGRLVMLSVVTRDGYGVPHNPTSEPTARIYSADGSLVQSVQLAAVRDYTGLFRLGVLLGDDYAAGRYDVLYYWAISSTTYSEWGTFEVDDGGDPWGRTISLYHHINPEDVYVLAQLTGGQIVAGRRPQFS